MINLAVPKGKYLLLQSVYDYSLVLTAILAAWCVWYTKDIMRVFCILILIILCSELIGVYMVKVAKLESNYLVYNIFNPIEFIILICSVFYYKIDDKKHILRGLVLTVYLIILGTTTYHFGGIALKFNNIAYISGGLLLV
ncbi:MAG: hypothetical protein NTX03_15340, partial [Bacteroidetes bacterium]|nr:hypothetical protein [Bacteroidota bacterium]